MDNLKEQSKNDSLARGEAFRQMVRSEGWKFIKKYFEAKIQALATSILIEDKPIAEFENERRELMGVRKLFGFVDNDIKVLENENKDTGVAKEQ